MHFAHFRGHGCGILVRNGTACITTAMNDTEKRRTQPPAKETIVHCPHCNHELPPQIPGTCPGCGADLDGLRELQALRTNLALASDLAGQTAATLADMRQRLDDLEHRIAAAPAQPAATPESDTETTVPPREIPGEHPEEEPAAIPAENAASGKETALPPARPETPQPPAAAQDDLETRFGQKVLLIAGLAITLLGVGYFLKYAFDRDWVGPAGRVAISYLWGMAFLGGGEWLRRRWRPFGLSIIGGGIAVLYLSSWAAFQRYELLGQTTAFGFMILTTVLACTLSVIRDNKWLAVLGLVGGFASPFLVSTGTDNQIFLMTYIAILNGGVLAVGFAKRWRLLTYVGFFLTWALMFAWMGEWYSVEKFWPTLIFANMFFIVYAITPLAYYLRRDAEPRMSDLGLMIPDSYIAFGLCVGLIYDAYTLQPAALVSLIYAGVFMAFGLFIRRRLADNRAMLLMLGQAIVFLAATVPLLFSQHWITVLWAVQAVVLLWLAQRLASRSLGWGAAALAMLTADKFVLYDLWQTFGFDAGHFSFDDGWSHLAVSRWMTHVAVLGMLFVMGRGFGPRKYQGDLALMFRVLFGVLLVWVLNMETGGLFNDYLPRATFAAISVLWTLISVALMAAGFVRQTAWMRQLALACFGLTVIKVFFVDMSNISTPFRIVSFMVLGLVLIGASFLYHKYKHRLLPDRQPPDPPEDVA